MNPLPDEDGLHRGLSDLMLTPAGAAMSITAGNGPLVRPGSGTLVA